VVAGGLDNRRVGFALFGVFGALFVLSLIGIVVLN
jgi:hypothetical protein